MKFTVSRLTFTFDSAWLDAKRTAGVRVVRQLEKWVACDAEAKLVSSSATSLTVEMKPAHRSDFTAALGRELVETYGEESPWQHVEGLGVPSGQKARRQRPVEAPRRDEPPPKRAENGAGPAGAPPPDPGKVVDEICASVPVKHSREMTAYVRETASIIPMLPFWAA